MARIAIEPHNLRQVYPEYTIIDGSYADFERERVACLIGQDLAHVHNLKFAGRMTLVGDIFPVTMEFTVRAIYDFPADNESMFFNLV